MNPRAIYLVIILVIHFRVFLANSGCNTTSECNIYNFSYPIEYCLQKIDSHFGRCLCIYKCMKTNNNSKECEIFEKCEQQFHLNISVDNNATKFCNFRKQNSLITIALSFLFFNIGLAQFYMGSWILGILQLLFGILISISFFTNLFIYTYTKPFPDQWNVHRRYHKCCVLFCFEHTIMFSLFVAWWIIDLLLFSMNSYSNGYFCTY